MLMPAHAAQLGLHVHSIRMCAACMRAAAALPHAAFAPPSDILTSSTLMQLPHHAADPGSHAAAGQRLPSSDRLVNGLTSEERRGALNSAVSYRPPGTAPSPGLASPASSSSTQQSVPQPASLPSPSNDTSAPHTPVQRRLPSREDLLSSPGGLASSAPLSSAGSQSSPQQPSPTQAAPVPGRPRESRVTQTPQTEPRQPASSSGSGDGGSRQALLAPGGPKASRGVPREAKPAVPPARRERPRQGVGLGPSSSGGFGNYPSSSGRFTGQVLGFVWVAHVIGRLSPQPCMGWFALGRLGSWLRTGRLACEVCM